MGSPGSRHGYPINKGGLNLQFVLWATFLITCLLAGWLRHTQNTTLYQAARQYDKQYKAFDQAAAVAIRRATGVLSQLSEQDPPPTRTEVEDLLNDGRPFETTRENGMDVAKYREPISGLTCELRFADGRIRSAGFFSGNLAWPTTPRPSQGWLIGEGVRKAIVSWGPLVWLAIMPAVVYLVIRARTLTMLFASLGVDTLLMMSILLVLARMFRFSCFFVAGKLSGGYKPHIDFFPTIVITCTSLALLLWSKFRVRRIPPGFCQVCEYNLTGNVSWRCPECGTPIEREEEAG